MKQVRRFIYLWITFLLLFTTFAFAFDSEGQNNRCPGEYIWTRSQYYSGSGVLNNRAGDWRDVYRFRAPADGTVTISLYSRDAVDFKVGTYCPGSCSGQDITRKDNGSRYKSYSFRVKKGKTYYFTVFDGTWKFGYHTYSLSIKFPSTRRGTPPKINYIPNKTVLVNKSFSYYLRNYVRRTDGDRILGYELGGSLPPGVYFSRFSGILSGTPRRTGTYRLRFRARDKDGWSSYRYFYLIVIKKTPPYIKPIPDKTIILNKSFTYNLSNYVQKTEGDRILEYRLSGTLPSGLYFNRYTGIIRGTPRRTGTYKLSLKARDKDGWSNSRSFYIKVIKRDPPIIKPIPDQKIVVNTKYKFDLKSYVQPTDGDKILEYRLEGTLPKGLSFNKSSAYISGTPTVTGTYWLRFSARDKDGWSNRESFLITVTKPKYADAQDDSYEVRVGFKLRDNVLNNDTGSNLKVISHTNPSKGKLTINSDGTFTYEPTTKEVTYDSFKYTIIDKYGHKDSATVHLNITLNTQYEDIDSNDQIDFKIVNPPSTRNLPGNYLIIGNTSECLTTLDAKKTRSLNEILNAKCIDSYAGGRYGGNNGYIVRFIDIDGNRGIGAKTFNSTSANFTIPEGSEVVWAGLFWSAHFHSHQSYNPSYPSSQYYPKVTNGFFGFGNSSYQYINAKYDGHFDIRKTDANKVLIKLNGDKDYQVAQAIRLNYMSNFYTDHEGGPYSAYADITSWLKSHNIQPGKKYTLTVANVHATIGNDGNWMGEWGGWSAVIIYKNPAEHVKNITVYHGLAHIHGRKDLPDRSHLKESFTLSGFKLPKQGKVNGKLSLFSGEGEYNNYGDTMKIEGELPPGIPSSKKYNVFDGIIDKVSRDRISSTNPNNLKLSFK
ncbi:MAG: hypothetical protein GXO02_03865 [Epsilonproteobacteria bacterium]|nr:hypothetical protein [Campylobacterota bacterium]